MYGEQEDATENRYLVQTREFIHSQERGHVTQEVVARREKPKEKKNGTDRRKGYEVGKIRCHRYQTYKRQ